MKFVSDPVKAEVNLRKHGISFDEAESVFDDTLSALHEDVGHSIHEDRWHLIGRSDIGRILFISFTWRGEFIRIISARKPTKQKSKSMKKEKEKELDDDLLLEYHFDYSKAEWGKFAGKVERTKSFVYIDRDVAAAFSDSEAVNEALKQVIALSKLPLRTNGKDSRKKSIKTPTKKIATT